MRPKPANATEPTGPFFHLWIRGRDGVSHDEVHRFLRDGIAPAWTADANVKFMRLHLSEPFNADAWPTKGVTHDRTPEQMYDACVELAFDTPAEMRAFFASDAYRSTEAGLGRTLAAMHAFPVVATYSYLYDYRPTPVATRGWPVVSLIEALSATNQYEDRVTDLVAPPFQVTAAEQRSMAEQRLAAE